MSQLFATLVAFGFALGGCSMMGSDSNEPVSGVYKENTVTATATVTKIDSTKRLVTLQSDDSGKVAVVKCGPEVKNFAQIKVGDKVKTTYYESIAYEVHKPGTLTDTATKTASGVGTAPLGDKPGVVGA